VEEGKGQVWWLWGVGKVKRGVYKGSCWWHMLSGECVLLISGLGVRTLMWLWLWLWLCDLQ
jgi:hypothetical protein